MNLHPKIQGQVEMIQEIIVEAYPDTFERGVAAPEKYRPTIRETADHSLPVCLAMALLDGDLTVKQFSDGRWKAPEVLALAQKVKVEEAGRWSRKCRRGRAQLLKFASATDKASRKLC